MDIQKAIELLKQTGHNPILLCIEETPNGINAQLTTGNYKFPMIEVNCSQVKPSAIFEVLEVSSAPMLSLPTIPQNMVWAA